MKRSAIWAAAVLATTASVSLPCLAGEADSAKVLDALAGMAVPNAELGKEHGRGIVIGTAAIASGGVIGNSVVGRSVTGTISNNHSINNNVGITTVFQNTGNNSLFQQSTTISITIK